MKQKLRNLSAPANIIFAILAVFLFIAPLQWSGKVLDLIPGMEKADDYLLQAIVETVVLVIFLGITYLFGLWDIFKENAAGWTRSLYTGGFFIVYCLYAVVSGIYLCFLGEHGRDPRRHAPPAGAGCCREGRRQRDRRQREGENQEGIGNTA